MIKNGVLYILTDIFGLDVLSVTEERVKSVTNHVFFLSPFTFVDSAPPPPTTFLLHGLLFETILLDTYNFLSPGQIDPFIKYPSFSLVILVVLKCILRPPLPDAKLFSFLKFTVNSEHIICLISFLCFQLFCAFVFKMCLL